MNDFVARSSKRSHTLSSRLTWMQVSTVLLVLSVCTLAFAFNEFYLLQVELGRRFYSTSLILGRNLETPLSFLDRKEAKRVLSYLEPEKIIEGVYLFDAHQDVFAYFGSPSL